MCLRGKGFVDTAKVSESPSLQRVEVIMIVVVLWRWREIGGKAIARARTHGLVIRVTQARACSKQLPYPPQVRFPTLTIFSFCAGRSDLSLNSPNLQ